MIYFTLMYFFFFTCSVNLGTLLTSGEGGSSLLLFHPVFFTESYVTYDRELRRACCGLAGMCGQFYTRRPPNDCSLYRPPVFSKITFSMFVSQNNEIYKLLSAWWLLVISISGFTYTIYLDWEQKQKPKVINCQIITILVIPTAAVVMKAERSTST